MVKHLACAALAALGPASMAQANAHSMECQFNLECFDGTPCNPTSFRMDVIENPLRFSSVVGDASAILLPSEGAFTALAQEPAGVQLLTVSEGVARLSVHFNEGPIMANYLGTCEEAQ